MMDYDFFSLNENPLPPLRKTLSALLCVKSGTRIFMIVMIRYDFFRAAKSLCALCVKLSPRRYAGKEGRGCDDVV
jgi:hypothetical protein